VIGVDGHLSCQQRKISLLHILPLLDLADAFPLHALPPKASFSFLSDDDLSYGDFSYGDLSCGVLTGVDLTDGVFFLSCVTLFYLASALRIFGLQLSLVCYFHHYSSLH